MKKIVLLSLLLITTAASILQAQTTTWYVKADATGNNNGTSWANAYTSLADAISAASNGDSIFVAKGVYQPAGGSSFTMKEGVKMYGGFAGTEASLSERVFGATAADSSVLQGNGNRIIYNNFTSSNPMTAASVLDGFTITGGNVAGSGGGGGMYDSCASPTIAHCIFSGNATTGGGSGGGMANNKSSPAISNCIFSGNNTVYYGGGMYNTASSAPQIINCIFSGNKASDAGNGWGGGMCNYSASSALKIINCAFTGNSASYGGGLLNYSSSPSIINCTIAGNSAGTGGGVRNSTSSSPAITNCIIYGNSSGIANKDGTNNPTVTYSDVQSGYSGTGNINADPLFVSAPAYSIAPFIEGNYQLQNGSTCIDTGADTTGLNTGNTDVGGDARVVNDKIDMGAYEYNGTGVPVPSTNVTFRVDLSGIYVETNVYVTGNFNSWALGSLHPEYRMTKDTNNVYSLTLSIADSLFPLQYKFVNYSNGSNAWANQEHMSGSACGQGDDRYLALPPADTTLDVVGYNQCSRFDSSLVTLKVDMSSVDVSNGVYISGDFQGWTLTKDPLANSGSNNIYTFSRYFSKGRYIEYKFLNGNTWDDAETVVGPCSYNPSSNPNRYLIVPSHDTTITVKFGSCTATGQLPPPKMAFIGSSSTYGFGSHYPSYMSYVSQLGKMLGADNATATDFGRNSAAVAQVVSGPISYWTTVDYGFAKAYKPDILFFMLGANDVKNGYFTKAEYWADTKALLDTFVNINPNVKIWLIMPYRTGLSTEPKVVDSLLPVLNGMSDAYGYPLIDLHQESLSNPLFKLNSDSTHTDSTGYAIVAQKIYNVYTTPAPQLTQTGDSIMAPQGYYSYRWYRNGDTVSVADGGTKQNIKIAENGDVYKVLVGLSVDASDKIISNTLTATEALPVGLTDFKAAPDAYGNVLLTWNIADKSEVDYFEIEKSTDAHLFSPVGKVAVTGNAYSFEDKQVNTTGVLYYRVVIYTKDGHTTYSNIVSLKNNKNGNVVIFPNPAHTQIHLSIANRNNVSFPYVIINMKGIVVRKGFVKATGADIAISNFPVGVYFLNIENIGKYKFLKE